MDNFISVTDIEDPLGGYGQTLKELLDLMQVYREKPLIDRGLGDGKTIGLLFFNPSLRTRMSTIKAAQNLGMQVISMNTSSDGWSLETADGVVMDQGKAEHIKEAAAVMGAYCDLLAVRSFPSLQDREEDYKERVIKGFVTHAGVPIINLESATRHPLQSLTDVYTIDSLKSTTKPKVVLTWAPHVKALPQAVANSFVEWMQHYHCDLTIAHPPGFELASEFSGSTHATTDQDAALENADFVYVKNWSSYANYGAVGNFPDWRITSEKMLLTNQAALLHCLPVRRNVVIDDTVLDSEQSKVIEQAGNRVLAAQAVIKKLLVK
ncbi:MAG: acetylornithine carbamoyltransferase [Bacteroidota bacterium]